MYLCIDKPKQPKVMYEIKIFENPDFGQVRTTTGENGAPFFCAVDVCRALGYGNSREALRKHVMEDDVTKRDTIDSIGRKQHTSFINESGFYALVFSSKLPKAREFKHWVTSEVLLQIRKTCPTHFFSGYERDEAFPQETDLSPVPPGWV